MIKHSEDGILDGAIMDIAWSEDNKKIVIVGAGNRRGAAINVDGGGKGGDITGHNGTLLTVDISKTKPSYCVLSGEDLEVQIHKGPVYKIEKSIQKIHEKFVNKMLFAPWAAADGSAQFLTASGDKSVKMTTLGTNTTDMHQKDMHTMGINDMIFAGTDELVTCSSDRTVKRWKVVDNSSLTEAKVLNISDFDNTEYKDNVDKQQLGLLFHEGSGNIFAVNNSSDINVWGKEAENAEKTIRGHCNSVSCVSPLGDKFIVSGDNDGRVLMWNSETGEASRPSGIFKHKIVIQSICTNSENVYSGSGDQHMGHFKLVDGALQSVALVKKTSSILKMIATDTAVYVLYTDKTMEMLSAGNIEESLAKTEKMEKAVTFTYSEELDEIWVGDNKGFIEILDGKSIAPKPEAAEIKTQYGHPCHSMTSSGGLVAVGDTKGYISIIGGKDRANQSYFSIHNSKVLDLHFSADNSQILSLGFDKIIGLGTIEGNSVRKLQQPNDNALTTSCCFLGGHIFSAGYDCSIRKWKY